MSIAYKKIVKVNLHFDSEASAQSTFVKHETHLFGNKLITAHFKLFLQSIFSTHSPQVNVDTSPLRIDIK